jgi:hypothetical protein
MSLTDYEREIIANVERTGCHITSVFDPDGDSPPFAYSTGFPRSFGVGEVIVFGLPGELAAAMINEVTDRIAGGSLQLADGAEIADLLTDHVCVVRRVHPEQIVPELFNSAIWYANTQMGTDLAEAWQIFWPPIGTSLMPWDPDCTADVCALQPALYEGVLQ